MKICAIRFNFCFRFPADEKRKEIWSDKIGRPDFKPTLWTTICSEHFKEDDFSTHSNQNRLKKRRYLKECAVPTIFNSNLKIKRKKVWEGEKKAPKKDSKQGDSSEGTTKDHEDHSYDLPCSRELKRRLDRLVEENETLK